MRGGKVMAKKKDNKALYEYTNRRIRESAGVHGTTSFRTLKINGNIMNKIAAQANREKTTVNDWIIQQLLIALYNRGELETKEG